MQLRQLGQLARPVLSWCVPSDGQEAPAEWLIVHEVDAQPFLSVGRVPQGYLLRAHHIADFIVAEDGRAVSVTPAPNVPREVVNEAFERQVLPGIQQLIGAPTLHASAVATDAGTIAFVGGSGAGKSTLAAFLSRSWPLVADDYLPLAIDGKDVIATSSSIWVRVHDATTLGGHGEVKPPIGRSSAGKSMVTLPSDSSARSLRAIYAIGAGATVELASVSQREGYMALASQLHRIDPSSAALLEAELDFLQALVQRVPVKRLLYPRRFDAFEQVRRALAEDLSRETSP